MGRSLAELAVRSRTPLFMINGRPIYPIMGAAEDDQAENDDEKPGDEASEDEDHSADDKIKDPRIKELSDENARRRNEAKRLADELAEAKAKIKEREDADKSETERMTSKIAELEERTAQLIKVNQELSIKNAFLSDTKHAWRNPDTALKVIDLSEVDIDKDGKITGLDQAIKKLAESDSYLLEQTDDDTGLPKQPSGDRTKGKPQDRKVKAREDLVKKYAALQR